MYKLFHESEDNNYFFSTIENEIKKENNSYYEVLISEESYGKVHDSSLLNIDERKIYVKKDNKLSLDKVIEKIQSRLSQINHCNSKKIALILLYNFSFIDRKINSVEKFNLFLSWKTTVDINQLIIFNIPNNFNYNLSFGEFSVESLDSKKLSLMCEKIGTDFYELHGKKFYNNLSIRRKYFIVPIINIFKINRDFKSPYTSKLNEAYYAYFEELARYYYENFDYEFSEQQNLMTFLNNEFIELENFKLLFKPTFITMFLNIGEFNDGWIIPNTATHLNINFPFIENNYRLLKNELLKKYSYVEGTKEKELGNTIYTFLNFCSKAKRFCINGLYDEGFLHYVIALDLVFGSESNSTSNVSKRASVCTYRTLGKSYKESCVIIKNIYSERSNYVHNGKSINKDNIEIVETICKETLMVFFRLNKKNIKWDNKEWKKKLDLLIAHLNANELPTNEKFNDLGIK